MTINDSTLRNDVFKDIRDYIVTNKTSSASVNVEFNRKTPKKDQIVIRPIIPSEMLDKFGSDYGRRDINVIIFIYGSTAKSAAQLSDEVTTLLRSNNIQGIELVSIDDDYDSAVYNDNVYHGITLSCLFRRE